jgi:hypothetical protein
MLIWNIEKEAPALKLEAENVLHSFSWKGDGTLVATTGKDSTQVWDPRAEKPAIQVCLAASLIYLLEVYEPNDFCSLVKAMKASKAHARYGWALAISS